MRNQSATLKFRVCKWTLEFQCNDTSNKEIVTCYFRAYPNMIMNLIADIGLSTERILHIL